MAAATPLKLNTANGDIEQFQAADFVDISNGGTGGTTQVAAQTALGLLVGTDVQAFDTDLAALAALAATAGFLARTGAGAFAVRTLTAPAAGLTISNPTGAAGAPAFALANDLAAVEALAANGMVARTGTDTWTVRTIAGTTNNITVANGDGIAGAPTINLATVTDSNTGTFLKLNTDSFGRVTGTTPVVLGDISALANSHYVRLGSDNAMASGITIAYNAATTVLVDNDLVPKWYVDGVAAGLHGKPAVRVATAAALPAGTLTANVFTVTATGTLTVDGVVTALGDRILVKDQASGLQNGIYEVTTAGAVGVQAVLTRADDFNTSAEAAPGSQVWVNEGTTNVDTSWALITNAPITLNTTALVFSQNGGITSVIAGDGLVKTGNRIDVDFTSNFTLVGGGAGSGQLDLSDTGVVATTDDPVKLTINAKGRVTATTPLTPADIGAQPVDADLTALAALAATAGFLARTGAGTFAVRTFGAPAAGLTISNPTGAAGAPAWALANDLAALEGLAGTGFAARTAADTWAQRTVTGSANISVADGNGVAGNPTLDLTDTAVTPGTYGSVTVDQKGRVTGGTVDTASSNNVTTLTNNTGSSAVIGTPVYSNATGTFQKANANSDTLARPIGLLQATTANAAAGPIVTGGEITATTGEWDAITGQTGGLTTNAFYFLNTTTGTLTSTPPAAPAYIIQMGQAVSTTKMVVNIQKRIRLA